MNDKVLVLKFMKIKEGDTFNYKGRSLICVSSDYDCGNMKCVFFENTNRGCTAPLGHGYATTGICNKKHNGLEYPVAFVPVDDIIGEE